MEPNQEHDIIDVDAQPVRNEKNHSKATQEMAGIWRTRIIRIST